METTPSEPEPTFGERFLDEWKRLGGLLSSWSYAEIQELRGLDREGMAQALRRHHPLTTHKTLQRLRSAESPELLARDLLLLQAQAQAGAQASVWLMLAMLAMPT
jgi:hypothetical protein